MTTELKTRKKLIEVALPLEAINIACAAEKQPGIGAHPRGLHLWWARRPLAAARAVIFAQMVDDPSDLPELFPTEKKQDRERQRLFRIIEDLVQWENTTNEMVLQRAREEIWQSWRRACADNIAHPDAEKIFNRDVLPAFHDPFAGGGALPLEAQRLGLESYASDLNPVAVLINKAMIEIPPKFAGRAPVNPTSRNSRNLIATEWKFAKGLVDDVRYYGEWLRDEAQKRIGNLYPPVEVTAEMAKDRPDLKQYVGQKLTVIAWIWVRTVKSPNPAFSHVDVPLASTFMLSTKAGKEAYVEPIVEGDSYRFEVRTGMPKDLEATKLGTSAGKRAAFRCLLSEVPINYDHIRSIGKQIGLGSELMAIVAEGPRGRVYLSPNVEHSTISRSCEPSWRPDGVLPDNPRDFKTPNYGLKTFGDLFTSRQLVALTTFSDLVGESIAKVETDAIAAGVPDDNIPLWDGGCGAQAYSEAVGVYLAFVISRLADYNSSIATWKPSGEQVMQTYKRQAIPMTWDYPESNVFGKNGINWQNSLKYTTDNLSKTYQVISTPGKCLQAEAAVQQLSNNKVVSTDPPYYDNIGYADLSDFFYVWLRKSLRGVYPELFSTLAVPKIEELIATPYRHGSKEKAESFFLSGMTLAMNQISQNAHIGFPVTIYYAFKQAETSGVDGTSSTGWETFLQAVIDAGFRLTGTWPMRTELGNRMIGSGTNALASSIVLVCRKQNPKAPTTTRRGFISDLQRELPVALRQLQEGNIAPVDLAQAAIGPGMSVFTRYSKVLGTEGNPISVKDALVHINQVLDETLSEQEGDFDSDSRWAITWFSEFGFAESEYGTAEQLGTAKGISVAGLVEAGIVESGKGKVRLLRPKELPLDWNPAADSRITHWEIVHQLIRALESTGEAGAARLARKIPDGIDTAKDLAYRLYSICERKKRSLEAQSYNALVQSFGEITKLMQELRTGTISGTQAMDFLEG
jgi:putative DNA methylase